jgi:hypothetical protein
VLDCAGALALMAQACAMQGDTPQAQALDRELAETGWLASGVDTPSRARMLAAIRARTG